LIKFNFSSCFAKLETEGVMISKVNSATVIGLNAKPIEVEVDISAGLPQFLIVGLPDKAVGESKERVRAALKNSGIIPPSRRIIVNLAPADLPKVGPSYDLPIALSLILAEGHLGDIQKAMSDKLFIGELSLNGDLRPVSGILPIAILAKQRGFNKIFLPSQNAAEAGLVSGLEIYPVKSLAELISHLKEEKKIRKFVPKSSYLAPKSSEYEYDFAYIKGQEQAKRALEIAAAGMHNVFMSGPPGGGKTLLARSLPSIMPRMTDEEMLDISKIYSVAGLLSRENPLVTQRPFRNPHHTSSNIALVGGGQYPKPGEITLAHKGVLFLDELPEFGRAVLEALRQPLEDRVITVSRAAGTLQFPAHFILVGAMNPCPCGFLTDPVKQCICSPTQIIRYQKRISGPLLDRIDIHLEVPRIKYEKLADERVAEESKKVRKRVEEARDRQRKRFSNSKIKTNSEMRLLDIKKYCKLIDEKSQELLKQAVNQLHLSPRAYYKILKLARTIADLAKEENIQTSHIAEAIQYRPKEIVY
jgi:magnesium chelatase family protein